MTPFSLLTVDSGTNTQGSDEAGFVSFRTLSCLIRSHSRPLSPEADVDSQYTVGIATGDEDSSSASLQER